MLGYKPSSMSLGPSANGGSSTPDGATATAAAPEPKRATQKPVTFSLPPGVDLGGNGVGDSFEVVALLCVEKGGKVTLDKINGIPLSPDDSDDQPTDQPGFQDSVEAGIPASQ